MFLSSSIQHGFNNRQYLNTLLISLLVLRIVVISFSLISNTKGRRNFIGSLKLKPAQSFVFGFLLLILTGSLVLTLPISISEQYRTNISYIDSLFTSTSAVCVTGLIVVDTGSYYSIFGQTVILLLIQFGGLGIMTFSSFIILLVGNKMSLSNRTSRLEIYDQNSYETLKALIKTIIIGTLLIELLGAVMIFFSVGAEAGENFLQRLYFSVFHSISAFCNAGFSLETANLMGFTTNAGVNIAVMILIVLGGIGFPVMLNIRNFLKFQYKTHIRKQQTERTIIRLQTKIVTLVTIVLIIIGFVLFMIFEWSNTMEGYSTSIKVMQSFFQSITTRTAGFNTLDTGMFREGTYFFMIVLMFIGASSGSTGGGIKTTTFYILFSTSATVLRDKKEVITFNKKINQSTINRAIAILSSYLMIAFIAVIFLMLSEKFQIVDIIFEVVSAIATVGLSTGITSGLTDIGRIIITLVMFTGRIGVLTFLYLFVRKDQELGVTYPEENISIG